MTTARCLIVPDAYALLAIALCGGLAGPAGEGMFVTALSPSGSLPATHYISQGMIDEEFASLLPLTSIDADGAIVTTPGQPETIVALSKGGVTLLTVAGLLAAIDVTEQSSFDAMDRLGLKMVQEAI